MNEKKRKILGIEIGSEREFGVVFAIFFFLIGLWPLLSDENIRIYPLIFGLLLLIISYIAPYILKKPKDIWLKLGVKLGAIISPIVMVLVYFLFVFPTGLLVCLFGKDLLNKKRNYEIQTYWIKRETQAGTMRNQF